MIGAPERDELFGRLRDAELRLGREIQVTIRPSTWLEDGTGSFHDTIVASPLVEVAGSRP